MTDFLFQMGLSNVCLSLALAVVATVVGARASRPQIAHTVWLLVFVKLVTPPIVTVPLVTIPAQSGIPAATDDHSSLGGLLSESDLSNVEASTWSKLESAAWNYARVWLPPIWLVGSVFVFTWSMVSVCRFSRILAVACEAAPRELEIAAKNAARRLGLKKLPMICTTSARISPMVWWTGGKVRIVITTMLLDQMDTQQSQWILAHELAHVRRRDYLVRWLEWLACVSFWWNPVVWWARRNLRAAEEICCDQLVISCLNPKPKSYANSLLSAVEFLALAARRPPAMASEINSGGYLERRFKMIVTETPRRPNSFWLQRCVLLCALVVLPFGIASAQDYGAVERRLGEAVTKGELSLEQAGIMMDALRKAGGAKKQAANTKSDIDLESAWQKLQSMVKAGELTQEQATAKMSAIKMEAVRKKENSNQSEAYLTKIKKELGEAVEAGKISKEDAAKKFEIAQKEIKQKVAAGGAKPTAKRITPKDHPRPEAELKKVVAKGKMSKDDLRAQLDVTSKAPKQKEEAVAKKTAAKKISPEDFEQAEAKIRKAIAEGKITEEQGQAKLASMRKMIGDKSQSPGKKSTDREDIKSQIEDAVKRGEITREQADAKYEAIRAKSGQKVKEKSPKGKGLD